VKYLFTKYQKEVLSERILKRLEFIEEEDTRVLIMYSILLDAVDRPWTEKDKMVKWMRECITPDMLFDKQLIDSEGRYFHGVLVDLMEAAGIESKAASEKPSPMNASTLLYAINAEEVTAEEEVIIAKCQKMYESHVWSVVPKNTQFRNFVKSPAGSSSKSGYSKEKKVGNPFEAPRKADAKPEDIGANIAPAAYESEAGPSNRDKNRNSNYESWNEEDDEKFSHEEQMEAARNLAQRRKSKQDVRKIYDDTEYISSKRKQSLTYTIMKKYERDEVKFTGTNGRSWMKHLDTFNQLGLTHDITDAKIMLQLIQWTLGPGPKMLWTRYTGDTSANWEGFKKKMDKTYNSEIVHARIRESLMTVSLRSEMHVNDPGDRMSKCSRAVTRTVDKILALSEDLPLEERTDIQMLNYLRHAIRGVNFAKQAQLGSIRDRQETFDKLSTEIQTAAQIEDSHNSKSSKVPDIYFNEEHHDTEGGCSDGEIYEQFFVDQRLGNNRRRRSPKCGDNVRPNGLRRGELMKCFDCSSSKHLAFHKDCPAQIKRRQSKSGMMDGARAQLAKGHKAEEVLACIAVAMEREMLYAEQKPATDTKSDDEIPVTHEVRFAIPQENSGETSDENDELFGSTFANSFEHYLSGSLSRPGF